MLRYIREKKWCVLPPFFFFFAVIFAGCGEKPKPAPPPEVDYIVVQPTNVLVHEEWIGTMDGLVNAQIRAQVTGYLQSLNYVEGNQVKKGDLLFEIDPRPFKAALDQAEGRLAQDKAQDKKAELDVERYTPLAKEQAISEETAVNAVQAHLAAQAQVQADEAAVESARLNLGFTRIISPVDGVAGIALGQIGDLVGQSGPLLTTVSTVDQIKVYFQVNEQSYLDFWQKYVSTMDTNASDLNLQLILSDGSIFRHPGRFYSADRQININTGTMEIVTVFPNPENILRPGQYAKVRALIGTQTNVFLVPQRAVNQLQSIYQVAVITTEGTTNTTHIRPVKVGRQIGSNWIIEDGLKAGDHLVVEGQLKAKEGAQVTPKQQGTPGTETNNASTNNVSTNSPR
jgi:membrane fusion protein, multidrug efflux system